MENTYTHKNNTPEFINNQMDKKGLNKLLSQMYLEYGGAKTAELANTLKNLGPAPESTIISAASAARADGGGGWALCGCGLPGLAVAQLRPLRRRSPGGVSGLCRGGGHRLGTFHRETAASVMGAFLGKNPGEIADIEKKIEKYFPFYEKSVCIYEKMGYNKMD